MNMGTEMKTIKTSWKLQVILLFRLKIAIINLI